MTRGRPRIAPDLKKEPVLVKLPRWLIDWMATREESRAVLIEEAMRKTFKVKPPTS